MRLRWTRCVLAWRFAWGLSVLSGAACATPEPAPKLVASNGLPSKENIPDELLLEIARAEKIGALLYRFDRMADVGTVFFAAHAPQPVVPPLAGSVTVLERAADYPRPTTFVSVFLTQESPTRIAYRVHIPEGAEPSLEAVAPPVSPDAQMLSYFRARQAALAAIPKWNGAMNAVVLPAEVLGTPGRLVVYLIRRESGPRELAFGMHYRVSVSTDGGTVQAIEPLSDISYVRHLGPEDEARNVWPAFTNFRLDHPSEADVMLSLRHGDLRFGVLTEHRRWSLRSGLIGAASALPPPVEVRALAAAARQLAAEAHMPESALPAVLLRP